MTISPQVAESEFRFENMFSELPDGYFYSGDLTVTKLVMRGTEAEDSTEVFYAGIFNDAAYADLYQVVALEMDGSSETSVTIPVPLGENVGDTKTYYVTETDEEGNPLSNGTDLAYTISVDQTEIEVSINGDNEVRITNTYPLPTDTPTPTLTSGPTDVPAGGSSTTGNVRTGDDTPIAMYAAFLALAVVVIILILVSRRRKK